MLSLNEDDIKKVFTTQDAIEADKEVFRYLLKKKRSSFEN